MDYLKYIFYLGIVYVVFSMIWFFIAKIPKFFLKGDREEQPWEGYALKAVQYYFIASLTLLKASEYLANNITTTKNSFTFFLLGGIILYLYTYGKYERTKQFSGIQSTIKMMKGGKMGSVNVKEQTKYVPHLIGIIIIFYFTALQFPFLVQNGVNYWLLESINDFYDTIIIGWILAVVGFFFMLGMISKGFSATGELVQTLIGLATGKPYVKKKKKSMFDNFSNFGGQNNTFAGFNPDQNPMNQEAESLDAEEVEIDDDEYVDFEVIDDENENSTDK